MSAWFYREEGLPRFATLIGMGVMLQKQCTLSMIRVCMCAISFLTRRLGSLRSYRGQWPSGYVSFRSFCGSRHRLDLGFRRLWPLDVVRAQQQYQGDQPHHTPYHINRPFQFDFSTVTASQTPTFPHVPALTYSQRIRLRDGHCRAIRRKHALG